MRNLATEPKEAYKHLGPENGQVFIGLVADFRAALFAGDVPSDPMSVRREGNRFELEWFVASGCSVKTVVAAKGNSDDAWKDAHRIRLECVTHGKEILA
ncbi:MAG: hypothetical protein COA52_11500 [Hyphomicrobiales bacterium]|nr:MAG: hypothetical protein COA52_11500 [Hyphomicrobiales bacterium]